MFTTMRFILTFIFFGTLIVLHTSADAQSVPTNIAVVDFERVFSTAAAPKSIRDQIEAKRNAYRTEVQKEEADLRKKNQELAQKQALLSPEAFKEERRKFEQKVLEVQKNVQEKNLNLQKAQSEALEKVKVALRKIVLQISQEKGYALVIRREQTVVVADPMDISKLVISELDKQLPTIKVFSGK
jgi:outer membrane protein